MKTLLDFYEHVICSSTDNNLGILLSVADRFILSYAPAISPQAVPYQRAGSDNEKYSALTET